MYIQTRRMPNAVLFQKIVDQIDWRPELWDQRQWVTYTACGTAHCVAGWALTLCGFNIEDMRFLEVMPTAARLLGLTMTQADEIFFYTHTVAGVFPDGEFWYQHPTLEDMKRRITDVTGVMFRPTPDPEGVRVLVAA